MSLVAQPGAPGARSQLSAGVRIVGEFQAPGHLELGGRIEGTVIADSVVVEEQGAILGEVRGGAVGIKGTFEGVLRGGAVRLHATARVLGDVHYDTISIEPGAEVTAAFQRVAPAGPAD